MKSAECYLILEILTLKKECMKIEGLLMIITIIKKR